MADVVRILAPVFVPLTVASWMTGPNRALQGARPIDVLRDGGADRVPPLARQLAADASG